MKNCLNCDRPLQYPEFDDFCSSYCMNELQEAEAEVMRTAKAQAHEQLVNNLQTLLNAGLRDGQGESYDDVIRDALNAAERGKP